MRKRVGSEHPGGVGVRRLVEISMKGERLRPRLPALDVDEFEHILFESARRGHEGPMLK